MGVGARNADLGLELLGVLENGCVIIPRITGDGLVCVDKQGVFLLKTDNPREVERVLNGIGSQSDKFILESRLKKNNVSWRYAENWSAKNVKVIPVNDSGADNILKNAQELVKARPFYSELDYYLWERRGQQGTVRLFAKQASDV